MTAVVRAEDDVVQVLDATGSPIVRSVGPDAAAATSDRLRPITAPKRSSPADGQPWRVVPAARPCHRTPLLRRRSGRHSTEAAEQWWTLLRSRSSACRSPCSLRPAVAGGSAGTDCGRCEHDGGGGAGHHRKDARRPPDGPPVDHRDGSARPRPSTMCWIGSSSALSTQRRFMADASHELRTPVSIMRTAAEVTLSQPRRRRGIPRGARRRRAGRRHG